MADVAEPLPSSPIRIGAFCASDPNGHPAVMPPLNSPRNSRRFMPPLRPRIVLAICYFDRAMSALGLAHCRPVDVRFGSLADIRTGQRDVRFTPESGH